MPELLIELFSEEIPARMQARARDDLKSMIELLKALVATKHDGIGERSIRERVELCMAEHEAHLKSGTKLFK